MSDKGKASAKPAEKPRQVDAPKKTVSTAAMQASARKMAAQAGGMARPTAQKQASPSDAGRPAIGKRDAATPIPSASKKSNAYRTAAGKRDAATPLSAKGVETANRRERPNISSSKNKENARRMATAIGGKETSRVHSRYSAVKNEKSSVPSYVLELMKRGRDFQETESRQLREDRKEYSEVQVKIDDRRKGRIDIYKPRVGRNGEVIENKYTRLGRISDATYNKYIKQLKGYLGREIYSPKYPKLNNKIVNKDARPVLVIPRQSYRNVKERAIADRRKKDARERGIDIRESTSTSL